ncbi:hypothetical protein ACFU99_27145 [Streptomyces sp. NPDC057654]|uniref:hypothetical protein n=1 Tax=Streptomyces sp. NPDC057654 TaxID=3346196 RepID=UPI0036BB2428
MSGQTWTIDSIAHTLPHPELRQTFMREVNFTAVDDLPGLLARWVRSLEEREGQQPGNEALRAHFLAHGVLPSEHEEESAEGRAQYEQWKARRKGNAA